MESVMIFDKFKYLPLFFSIMALFVSSSVSAQRFLFNKENQTRPFDESQQLILNDAQLTQEQKAQSLTALYFQFYRVDLLKAYLKEDKANSAFQDKSFHYFLSAFIQYREGKYESANSAFKRAKTIAHKSEYLASEDKDRRLAIIELYIAINDAYLQNYTRAIERLRKVRVDARSRKWGTIAAKAHYFLGVVNYELKDYESALEHFTRAESSYPREDRYMIAEATMRRAQMINIVGERSQALQLLEQAIALYQVLGDKNLLAYSYLLKGYFLNKDNQHQQAIAWFEKSVLLREQLGNPLELANIYVHYSAQLLSANESERALEYAQKAVTIAESIQDLSHQWDAYVRIAKTYYVLANYKLAYEFMSKAERTLLNKARLDITAEAARLNSQSNLEYEKLKNQMLDTENAMLQTQLQLKVEKQKQQEWLMAILTVSLLFVTAIIVLVYHLYAKNKKLASQDALTGLHNRRRIMEIGSQSFVVSKRYEQTLSVMMLDIDNFKQINDKYGHKEGDKVLSFIANVCRETLRGSDFIGRIGGEEFLIVLPNTSIEESHHLAKRLCADIHQASIGAEFAAEEVTVSVGVTQCTSICQDFSDMVNKADIALYEAKNSGRNRVERYQHQVAMSGSEIR